MRFVVFAVITMVSSGCLGFNPEVRCRANNAPDIMVVLPELGLESARSATWPDDVEDFIFPIKIVNERPIPVFVLANNHEDVFYRLEYRTGFMHSWMPLDSNGDSCCPFSRWYEIPSRATRTFEIWTDNPVLKGYHRIFLRMMTTPDGVPNTQSNFFDVVVYPDEPERTEVNALSP